MVQFVVAALDERWKCYRIKNGGHRPPLQQAKLHRRRSDRLIAVRISRDYRAVGVRKSPKEIL